MKPIKIKSLVLRNFKGFTFTLEADCNNVSAFGANATGKTTLADAWHWLLCDKDSLNRAEFEIKPILSTGEHEHNIESSVEANLFVDDNPLALKKTYKEVYQRKRGSAEATFTGHTSEYWINGVPVKMNDYKSQVSSIIGDESIFRLLTSPSAFPSLPWQKARTILLDCCGDIPDKEIIDSDGNLFPLRAALAKYTASKTPLDDLKKVTMGRRSEINKQLDQIPVRIDETRQGLPEVEGLDKEALSAEIANYESQLNGAKLKLAGVDTGGKIAPLTKELNSVSSEISSLENEHYLKYSDVATKLNQLIRSLAEEDEAAERKAKSIKAEGEEKKARISSLEKTLSLLRDKWNGVDGEEFQDTVECVCPACGQELPEDRIEAARERARAAFNASKAERLESIQIEGKRLAAEKERLTGELNQLATLTINYETAGQKGAHREEIERLTRERDDAKIAASAYSEIVGRQDLLDRKAVLEKAIAGARNGLAGARKPIEDEIAEVSALLLEAKEKFNRFERRSFCESRVKELKQEEKKLAKEFEEMERLLFLMETFIKRKVSMLNDKINSKFEIVRFKLFNVLVNQGIEETCEMTVGGVPYNSGLNNAARINGGLDVIRTLQKHYGMALPIFVDNAESVVDLLRPDCQMIRLVVSGRDRCLRVEVASERRQLEIAI
ncbi:MAG: hypothetical protein PHE11_05475 [Candidatus Omnitrophica bacterium]|nr:hypothetical protein [Candidatus Omnitrophota bacterium]